MSLLPAEHEIRRLGADSHGPNNRTLVLLCRTAFVISHVVKTFVKPHEIGYVCLAVCSGRIITKQGKSFVVLSLNWYVMTQIVYVSYFHQNQYFLLRHFW